MDVIFFSSYHTYLTPVFSTQLTFGCFYPLWKVNTLRIRKGHCHSHLITMLSRVALQYLSECLSRCFNEQTHSGELSLMLRKMKLSSYKNISLHQMACLFLFVCFASDIQNVSLMCLLRTTHANLMKRLCIHMQVRVPVLCWDILQAHGQHRLMDQPRSSKHLAR